jgi:peroxiredoxin Q/BCP
LADFLGKPVVLYFYPRDNTPGCTKEACGIRDSWSEFERRGAVVLGVSPDSVSSHRRFKVKHGLPFTLLADIDHEVAERYGVWKPKRFAGKTILGVVRSTFLIDAEGKIVKVWPKVDPATHADLVIAELDSSDTGKRAEARS